MNIPAKRRRQFKKLALNVVIVHFYLPQDNCIEYRFIQLHNKITHYLRSTLPVYILHLQWDASHSTFIEIQIFNNFLHTCCAFLFSPSTIANFPIASVNSFCMVFTSSWCPGWLCSNSITWSTTQSDKHNYLAVCYVHWSPRHCATSWSGACCSYKSGCFYVKAEILLSTLQCRLPVLTLQQ